MSEQLVISFIYNMNKRGPRTDPCATPHDIELNEDEAPLKKHIAFYSVNNF